jgi:chromosome segregation ATPase
MYIFGGRTQDANDLGDLAAFRITSRRWYTFQNMGPSPSPRSGHSMTAYGQQIVVLAGEPSSTPRDPSELSLVYILDTAKIRYPNDQQAQQPPPGERIAGSRRPSQDKSGIPQAKGMYPQDGPAVPPEGPKRLFSGSKDAMLNGPIANSTRVPDISIANGSNPAAPGSRLPQPRAASASGPPPLQQAPPPRTNGIVTPGANPRSMTPTREPKGFGPPLDTSGNTQFDRQDRLPNVQEAPREAPRAPPPRAMSPATNLPPGGRPTPTPQLSRLGTSPPELMEPPLDDPEPPNLQTRQVPRPYIPPTTQYPTNSLQQQYPNPIEQQAPYIPPTVANSTTIPNETVKDPRENSTGPQIQALTNELNALKSKNIWYASELALAKKAGYVQDPSHNLPLNEKTRSIADNEKPLIEALIAMKAELAEVQSSVETRVKDAAQMVAEVEQQRDAAIREAAYAKAKLAAHSGSQAGTPQLDDSSRDIADPDRTGELNRRLASALGHQTELQSKLESITVELTAEKKAREIAEESIEAANRRIAELEKSRDPGAVESLKAELHEAQRLSREENARRLDAEGRARLLEVDVEDLKHRLDTTSTESNKHLSMLTSLRDAITASQAKSAHLERKLDDEREQREAIQRKLLQLRSEHEERTSELESTSRKLRDAEELAEKHANEAQLHRSAILSGFDKLNMKSTDNSTRDADNERVAILQQQVADANALVKKNQADADSAAEKLRRAEERIAGLEAYQEQSSRESLGIRRQLQEAVRTAQSFQAQHTELKRQLESHQRDASAMSVQHSALKELLDERPATSNSQNRSRGQSSPADQQNSPDAARLRELEQKFSEAVRAHEETKATFAEREQSSEKQYRDKLEQLEQDYQSAVSYVKGTEKMLKRMKDELSKSKASNARLQAEIDKIGRDGNSALDEGAAANWEAERQALRKEIEEMQLNVKTAVNELERQMQDVKSELRLAQEERDHWRVSTEQARKEMEKTTRQQKESLEQLKLENRKLESRAVDAETKVGLLLDQVESSVDAYRRQSSQLHSSSLAIIPTPIPAL